MKKQITLKFDVEFAKQAMEEIPNGYINKTVCGCGLTTVALENAINTIIVVPTINLVINKAEQYPNDRCSYKILGVWGETKEDEIAEYVFNNNPLKIMVTVDSLHKVKHLLDTCKLVIDESNELLKISRTDRKEAVSKLIEIAYQYKDSVSFISATPTDLKYLPEWISNIDQVRIEWTNTIKSIPIICERTYPFKSLKEEFLKPLKANGIVTVAGKSFQKAIIFINSVTQVVEIIKETELDKTECGIICGDTVKNDVKIRGINRYNASLEMPKYLFITSSGFCGIDIKDNSAMPIVVSNTSKSWQMIDMLTDLKQAVSRQRDKTNPNYGYYIFIYNQTIFKKSESELIEILDSIYDIIKSGIEVYKAAVNIGEEKGFMPNEKFKNYTIFKDNEYIINENAFNADKYFILEIRNQYTKGFDINGKLENAEIIEPVELPKSVTYIDLVEYFNANNKNGLIDWNHYSVKTNWITMIETSFKLYGKVWKDFSYAKKMVENYGDTFGLLKATVAKIFTQGKRYSRKDVKEKLQVLYDLKSIKRKAKHSDLMEFFKQVKDVTVNGERYVEIVQK